MKTRDKNWDFSAAELSCVYILLTKHANWDWDLLRQLSLCFTVLIDIFVKKKYSGSPTLFSKLSSFEKLQHNYSLLLFYYLGHILASWSAPRLESLRDCQRPVLKLDSLKTAERPCWWKTGRDYPEDTQLFVLFLHPDWPWIIGSLEKCCLFYCTVNLTRRPLFFPNIIFLPEARISLSVLK